MGRSVSTPSGAIVTYRNVEIEDEDNNDDIYFQFAFLAEDVTAMAKKAWPSMEECNKWIDREDQAILENNHAYFGLSEYCGLVAIWIVPKDTEWPELSEAWTYAQEAKLKKMGSLKKIGTASNGESFFEHT